MRAGIGDLVEFLDASGQLRPPSENPWPSTNDGDEVLEVDWARLFGSDRNREWEPEFPPEILQAADDARRSEPPSNRADLGAVPSRADVCAWYQPIHFYGPSWGIFLRDDCLVEMALDILRFAPRWGTSSTEHLFRQAWRLSFSHLYLHEAFHHRTESFAVRLHIARQRPAFHDYWSRVYLPDARSGGAGALEEALANAVGYRNLGIRPHTYGVSSEMRKAAREYLKWAFPALPAGYRDAVLYLSDEDFAEGEMRLLAQVDEAVSFPPLQRADELGLATQMSRGLFDLRTATWAVVPAGSTSILPTFPRLKTVSSKELEAGLRRGLGYERVKGAGKGSHIKLRAPGRGMVVIPGDRKEVSPVVLKSTAQSAGFGSTRELLEWLDSAS